MWNRRKLLLWKNTECVPHPGSYGETVKAQRVKGRKVEPQFHPRKRIRLLIIFFSFHASTRTLFPQLALRYRELQHCVVGYNSRAAQHNKNRFAPRLRYNTIRAYVQIAGINCASRCTTRWAICLLRLRILVCVTISSKKEDDEEKHRSLK